MITQRTTECPDVLRQCFSETLPLGRYHLILCMDPLLLCRHLQGINLPVMAAATGAEVAEHPEILDAIDYLLPLPTNPSEEKLLELTYHEIVHRQPFEQGNVPRPQPA